MGVLGFVREKLEEHLVQNLVAVCIYIYFFFFFKGERVWGLRKLFSSFFGRLEQKRARCLLCKDHKTCPFFVYTIKDAGQTQ